MDQFITLIGRRIRALSDAFMSLFASLTQRGGRSTAMKSILTLFGLSSLGLVSSIHTGAHVAVISLFAFFAGASFLAALWAFVYLLRKDPSLLRSEWYNLESQRIEKGLIGDSSSGVRTVSPGQPEPLLLTGSARTDDK